MNELLDAWPILLALVGVGVVAGVLAGLLGVGGGIVIVPALYFLLPVFGVSPGSAMAIAVATSLATIVPTSIASLHAHAARGNVRWDIITWWGGFILLAAVLGSLFSVRVNAQWLTYLFALIAILVSLKMLFQPKTAAVVKTLPGKAIQAVLAGLIGLLSVMIGIGGGTIGVPTLSALNLPTHQAVGTAASFGLLIALPGAVTLLLAGQAPPDAPVGNWGLINMPAFLCIVPLTVLFAPIGVRLGARLNQLQLKKVFAVVLVITGVRMLITA